ncbi:hypothetical protein Sjap_023266 [Stephania japonica]|uniref:C2H2-type domain-containing protein n=1 Tax=Stephania japonica TaxID=461633 RepID=A0AAP0HKA9_9MAGN
MARAKTTRSWFGQHELLAEPEDTPNVRSAQAESLCLNAQVRVCDGGCRSVEQHQAEQGEDRRLPLSSERVAARTRRISAETISAIPLESVEVNEVTPVEDYWSEPEEIIEVSLYEPDISITQNKTDEAKKEIDVILESPKEPQKESKEDQHLVLVKPPTLLCIFVRPYKGVVVKERSQIFYTAGTFMSDDHDLTDSYVLEVPDELLILKEGVQAALPKYVDARSARVNFWCRYRGLEISQWPPTTIIMIDSKTHTIMVEACDFCGESFHPTYACPYHPRYGNHHSSSYASPQPDFRMSRPSPRSPQQEWRTIEDMKKDMISDWLSPSTKKYPFDGWSNSSYQQDTYSSMQNQPSRGIIRYCLATVQDVNLTEQELDEWIEQRDQEAEEEIKLILQKISAETMSAILLESVEVNEGTPIEDYWSEPEEIIEVSLHEPNISIAQNEAYEAEKEINFILERPEEPQKRSKEDQPLVLVTPPTVPCLPVKFTKEVVIKERSQIFYMVDTFVSDDDDDAIDSYVLEVPNELLHLKEGMYDELPEAIDAPFVVDILKGEGIT